MVSWLFSRNSFFSKYYNFILFCVVRRNKCCVRNFIFINAPLRSFCFCFSVSVWGKWGKCSWWRGSALAPHSTWGSWWARVLCTWSCTRPGSCKTSTRDMTMWTWVGWRCTRTGGRRSWRCLTSTTRITLVMAGGNVNSMISIISALPRSILFS